MTGRTRDRIVSATKWTATVAFLGIVMWKTPLADVGARIGRIRASDAAALVAIAAVQMALSTMRWWRLLRRSGERVSYATVFGDVCVGVFYNFILPGGVGGDVVRALRARKRLDVPHRAWATSIYERLVGLFTMTLLASIAAIAGLGTEAALLPPWLRTTTIAMTIVLAVAIVLAKLPFRLATRILGKRLPEVARGDIDGIAHELGGPLTSATIRAETFFWSLLYQGASLFFVIASAWALGAGGHERALLVGIPIVYVLSMLPVTIGGHGFREGLYVGVLGVLGVSSDVALGLSFFFVASSLLFSIVGGVIVVMDSYRAR
jgi:uncharacterized membrane protein YbhN (UPF0104 family)